MPSAQKVAYFMACVGCSAVSVAILAVSMTQTWAETELDCDGGNKTFDGKAHITWELFDGFYLLERCPVIGSEDGFKVFTVLQGSGAPLILCALVVLFLVLCLISSALCILIALYNSVGNPYETYMGPVGVYVCSSVSMALSVLVLIVYAVTVSVTNMSETLVRDVAGLTPVSLKNTRATFQLGYFLVILYMALSAGAFTVVYLYAHMSYTQRREQQRPTEDAPKETMMY